MHSLQGNKTRACERAFVCDPFDMLSVRPAHVLTYFQLCFYELL